jgi:hypothetical protein
MHFYPTFVAFGWLNTNEQMPLLWLVVVPKEKVLLNRMLSPIQYTKVEVSLWCQEI